VTWGDVTGAVARDLGDVTGAVARDLGGRDRSRDT
jgi:hypothetical protein